MKYKRTHEDIKKLVRLARVKLQFGHSQEFSDNSTNVSLTLKAPITAADDIHKYFFIVFIENKAEDSHEKIKPYCLRKIKVKN